MQELEVPGAALAPSNASANATALFGTSPSPKLLSLVHCHLQQSPASLTCSATAGCAALEAEEPSLCQRG